jgi:hypothetical protein
MDNILVNGSTGYMSMRQKKTSHNQIDGNTGDDDYHQQFRKYGFNNFIEPINPHHHLR